MSDLTDLPAGQKAAMKSSPHHALPRACRILRRPDFTLCYETGRRFFSRHFVLFVRPTGADSWRIGLAVSKKMGNAVRRNRIKRLLREFFRLHGYALPQGCDIVAVPKRDLAGREVDMALVSEDLTPLLAKIAPRRPGRDSA